MIGILLAPFGANFSRRNDWVKERLMERLPSTVGIRTKLVEMTDFVIDSPLPGYIEALGIESPGLTAAPAIAKKIVELL